MPHKHNAARRHHIGKMKLKVTNWAEYEAGLRRRGSLTLWITPEALAGWAAPRRKTRGGQPRYSDLAIETTLMLGMVFGLRLRQSEGFLSSVLYTMGLGLPVPDHTTLSRRARTWQRAIGQKQRPSACSGWPQSRSGRQHRAEDLWRRPMAGRKARCQIPSWLAKAAPGC
jgi:hypothetical protein